MAKQMKATAPAKRPATAVTVKVDPLKVARGHRAMKRGGVHATAKHPGRAAARRLLRQEGGGFALLV